MKCKPVINSCGSPNLKYLDVEHLTTVIQEDSPQVIKLKTNVKWEIPSKIKWNTGEGYIYVQIERIDKDEVYIKFTSDEYEEDRFQYVVIETPYLKRTIKVVQSSLYEIFEASDNIFSPNGVTYLKVLRHVI